MVAGPSMRLRTQASVTFAARAVSAGIALVQTVVVARLLSRQDFATIQQVMLVVMLAVPLLGGLFGGANYFLGRYERAEQKAFLWQSMGLSAMVGLAFAVVLLAAGPLLGTAFGNGQLPETLAVFCLFPAVALPSLLLGQTLICNQRVVAAAVLQVGLAATATGLVLMPILAGWPLSWFFRARLAAEAVVLAVTVVCVSRLYRGTKAAWSLGIVGEQLRYCLPAVFAGQLGKLSLDLDRLVVSVFFAPATMAVYAVGARQIPLTLMVRGAIANVTIPAMARHFARGELEAVRWLWKQVMRRHVMILVPLAVFATGFAKQIVVTLYGDKYSASAIFFQIYLVTMLWHCLAGEHVLQATGRTKVKAYTWLAGLVVNAAVSFATARAGWLAGPAVGTVVGLGLVVGLNATVAARTLGLRLGWVLPVSLALRVGALSMAGLVPALLVAGRFESMAGSLLAGGLCYAGCWAVAAMVLAGRELRQRLSSFWSAMRPAHRPVKGL